jgi:hypothetical protein
VRLLKVPDQIEQLTAETRASGAAASDAGKVIGAGLRGLAAAVLLLALVLVLTGGDDGKRS